MARLVRWTIATVVMFSAVSCASPGAARVGNAQVTTPTLQSAVNSEPAHALDTAVSDTRAQAPPSAPPPSRSVDSSLVVGCNADVLRSLTQRTGNETVRQWIVVLAPFATSTSASLEIATSGTDDKWHCSLPATSARLGRKGLRPLIDRRSGDDTTPSGIFALGTVNTAQGPISFFGNSPDPGALGGYRKVQKDDCYGAKPNSPGYGHWRSDASGCSGADERLQRVGAAYEHAVLIGANTEPNVSGDGPGEIPYASAIFLHRFTYGAAGSAKATSGCVSIAHDALVSAVRTIDPRLNPHFAIGVAQELIAG